MFPQIKPGTMVAFICHCIHLMTQNTQEKIFLSYALACLSFFNFHLSLPCLLQNDVMSFYVSTKAFFAGINPYSELPLPFGSSNYSLSINLNPPIFFIFFKIISTLPYKFAAILWGQLNFLAATSSLLLSFNYFKVPKKYAFLGLMLFFLSPAYLTNTLIGQLGSVFSLGLMLGIFFLKNSNFKKAGIAWGTIAAIKISPLFLLIFIFWYKNTKLFLAFISTFIFLSLLPLLWWDISIYQHWLAAIHAIDWYQYSLNNSLSGLLFKWFDSGTEHYQYRLVLNNINIFLSLLFSIGLIYFIQRNKEKLTSDGVFSLCTITLLIVNPLSWNYYSLALLFPALHLWQRIQNSAAKTQWRFILMMTAVLFPYQVGMVRTSTTPFWLVASFYSLSFYGLVGLLIFGMRQSLKPTTNTKVSIKNPYLLISFIAFFYLYGLWIFLQNYTFNISNLCLAKLG